ncbi:MAG: cytochrome c oxidase subunit II [bacterium]|nr:cytochrome c oxidase subunit II [bacterium]
MSRKFGGLLFAICGSILGAPALADGIAEPWQLGFQEPVTPVGEMINSFHNFVLIIIFAIAIFLFLLIAYALWRFREKKNPIPSKRTHNPILEAIWTLVPVVILVVIAFPSLKIIHFMDKVEDPELTLKVTGSQWYWNYELTDSENLNIAFESRMIPDEEIKPGEFRLLEVDEPVVLPINTKIRVLVTSSDVLHSWAVPAFYFKKDCAPGRISEAWIEITKEGIYYGQCSELCGMDHGFMPIKIRAVSREKFTQWAQEAQQRFASADSIGLSNVKVASSKEKTQIG